MNLISEITRGVFFMHPDIARQYFPLVHNLLTTPLPQNTNPPQAESFVSFASLTNNNTVSISHNSPNEPQSNRSLCVTDLNGPITKYSGLCHLGCKDILFKMQEIDSMDNIAGHILRIDSGGGEGYAAQQFGEGIKKLSKPVFAFVEGIAASAAYWIAASCQSIAASSRMDAIGSIGTYITLADYTQYYQKQGINILTVYASKSKNKNREFTSAFKGDKKPLQELVDQFNTFFLDHIMAQRADFLDLSADWDSGRMFFADKAYDIGLIDAVTDFDSYAQSILKTI